MSRVLNVHDVVTGIRNAISVKGRDYRYQDEHGSAGSGCVYRITSKDDTNAHKAYPELPSSCFLPACLIGWVFAYFDMLNLLEEGPITDRGRDFLTPDALLLAQVAQTAQDNGQTWGEAHDEVLLRAAELIDDAAENRASVQRLEDERLEREAQERELEEIRDYEDMPF